MKQLFNADSLRIALAATVIAVAGFWAAYQFVEPAPPKTLTIASGSTTGAYYAYAGRYAAILAKDGIELKVESTGGSVDNIARLADGRAQVAFVQGGVGSAEANPDFRALGSAYFEPLWVFTKRGAKIETLSDLAGKTVSAGGEGSGTWSVAKALLDVNGVDTASDRIKPLSSADAARDLLAGKLDAAFFVASPTAPLIRDLLGAKDLRLLNFARAEAYTSQFRHLSQVTLHQGVISLSDNVPPRDITLLAPAATVVAAPDLHPALETLLVRAMIEVHGAGGLFEAPGQFPSVNYTDYPMSDDASRYIEDGPPFLQRFMPFWAAVLFDRLIIMLIPLITLMIPLMKVLPPAYRWRVRSRIYRWYEDLHEIERRASEGEDAFALVRELDAMAAEVRAVKVPLSYADEAYDLRLHIDLIKRELQGG